MQIGLFIILTKCLCMLSEYLEKFRVDFHEIWRIGGVWTSEELMKFRNIRLHLRLRLEHLLLASNDTVAEIGTF